MKDLLRYMDGVAAEYTAYDRMAKRTLALARQLERVGKDLKAITTSAALPVLTAWFDNERNRGE